MSQDSDLVRDILSEMNAGGPSGNQFVPTAPPPPMGHNMPGSGNLPPVHQATMHMMDPQVPTAHMIGGQAPSPADFANMMHSSAPVMQQAWPQQQQQQAYGGGQKPASWMTRAQEEGKVPALVALIIFVITLPAVTVLFAHYAPSMLKPGGDLNTTGMLVRAALGGAAFWILQRVVGPLLSL